MITYLFIYINIHYTDKCFYVENVNFCGHWMESEMKETYLCRIGLK